MTQQPALSLAHLIASYPILCTLAEYVSTLDLFHLGLTNRFNHAHILASRPIFQKLIRSCLCDGRGLAERQNFTGVYKPVDYTRGYYSRYNTSYADEPIEVRLYNLKCDEAGGLPCVKCGINVCEECRYRHLAQAPVKMDYFFGRPHLNSSGQAYDIMCLCRSCDAKLESELDGQHLNKLCDCNIYTRWLCLKCKALQDRENGQYMREHTLFADDAYAEDGYGYATKVVADNPHGLACWCMCAAPVPEDIVPRCIWCKRRHRKDYLQEEDELAEVERAQHGDPLYDPTYPYWVTEYREVSLGPDKYPDPYPELGYSRLVQY